MKKSYNSFKMLGSYLGLILAIILLTTIISAEENKVNFNYENQNQLREMEQRQSRFENNYNFTCSGECEYRNINENLDRLEVRNQKRFLFWDVESVEIYDINEEGELIRAKYNIWSRLLNRQRIKING